MSDVRGMQSPSDEYKFVFLFWCILDKMCKFWKNHGNFNWKRLIGHYVIIFFGSSSFFKQSVVIFSSMPPLLFPAEDNFKKYFLLLKKDVRIVFIWWKLFWVHFLFHFSLIDNNLIWKTIEEDIRDLIHNIYPNGESFPRKTY